jgi:hypothetical protein
MKKLVLLLASTVIATSAFAQGTINFTNLKPSKQIITDSTGAKLAGADGGWAQLYSGTTSKSLSAVGNPVAFYTGTKAGYFSGGSVNAGFTGDGFFAVAAWKGADSYEAATERGMSNEIAMAPAYEADPTKPPAIPSNLAGLEAFSLTVIPEPGTIALAVLGLAAFFVRRRK